jgi:hypothetical protein
MIVIRPIKERACSICPKNLGGRNADEALKVMGLK